jgi:hypothetical protein
MGTIVASSLISRASILLQDTTNIRWTQDELLGWLNDGQREIVLIKPNACVKNQALPLVAGTKQSLPDDSLSLIDVTRNLGVNGTTPGPAIRVCSREILDAQLPNWHTLAGNATVKHYMYNPMDVKHFYVYPPQPATGTAQVELIYAYSPADIAIGAAISVDDIYATALVNYVLFRAYSKDTEYAANASLASAYYQAFTALLGAKVGGEQATDPNTHAPGNKGIA